MARLIFFHTKDRFTFKISHRKHSRTTIDHRAGTKEIYDTNCLVWMVGVGHPDKGDAARTDYIKSHVGFLTRRRGSGTAHKITDASHTATIARFGNSPQYRQRRRCPPHEITQPRNVASTLFLRADHRQQPTQNYLSRRWRDFNWRELRGKSRRISSSFHLSEY